MNEKLLMPSPGGITLDVEFLEDNKRQERIDLLSQEIERLKAPHLSEFTEALQLYDAQDTPASILVHEKILLQDMTYFPSWYVVGRLYDDVGRLEDSECACERATSFEISDMLRYEVESLLFLTKKLSKVFN